MKISAKQLAQLLKGRIIGDENTTISRFDKIEEGKPGAISFLANPKYEPYLYTTRSSIVLINEDYVPQKALDITLIKVKDAYKAIATLLQMYTQSKPQPTGIETPSYITENVKKGKDVYIGAFSYIGKNVSIGENTKIYPHCYVAENVRIGDNTIIYAGVRIYEATQIGSECIIHAGTVIGADGFGFAPQDESIYQKIPQIGNVVIEDSVEIGSNSSIDRATMGSTIIRKGVKLDNLIQVAHNVEIGENTVIAAQTGIAGSAKIGKNCMIGGQVGICGHINISDKTRIAAQSGVVKSTEKENQMLLGSPAFNSFSYGKSYAVFKKLPQLHREIQDLKKSKE